MLSEFFDKPTLKLLDYVMEFNEPFGAADITSISHKNGAELLQKLADLEVITCIDPSAPLGERKYQENQKSGIFNLLIKLDFEISTFLLKQKRQKIKEVDMARQTPDPNKRSHQKKAETKKDDEPKPSNPYLMG